LLPGHLVRHRRGKHRLHLTPLSCTTSWSRRSGLSRPAGEQEPSWRPRSSISFRVLSSSTLTRIAGLGAHRPSPPCHGSPGPMSLLSRTWPPLSTLAASSCRPTSLGGFAPFPPWRVQPLTGGPQRHSVGSFPHTGLLRQPPTVGPLCISGRRVQEGDVPRHSARARVDLRSGHFLARVELGNLRLPPILRARPGRPCGGRTLDTLLQR